MKTSTLWIAALSLCVNLCSAMTAAAQSNPVVVELFTSQGCSSCPPADALMHKLAHRDDVIALSMHVNYWDYIGWKDKFASEETTARQKSYAKAAGRRSVYTPQMIIGGTASVVGTHPMDVAELIAKQAQRPANVALRRERSQGQLQITASAKRPAAYDVVLIKYAPAKTVKIMRGENAGHTYTYANVVETVDVIQRWNGSGTLNVTRDTGTTPVAVFIQKSGFGAIDAAAKLK